MKSLNEDDHKTRNIDDELPAMKPPLTAPFVYLPTIRPISGQIVTHFPLLALLCGQRSLPLIPAPSCVSSVGRRQFEDGPKADSSAHKAYH